MKKYKILVSQDGKCPYCSSDFVIKTFSSAPSPKEESEEANVKVFKCYRCNKEFYFEEEG